MAAIDLRAISTRIIACPKCETSYPLALAQNVDLGFRYVRGLRQVSAEALVRERRRSIFADINDRVRRVPELQKPELVTRSELGALNSLGERIHRRSALWQVERASRPVGPLLESVPELAEIAPLRQMNDKESLVADFHGSGMTTGPHPMSYYGARLDSMN
jgi:error-prone DNA polymerase